MPRHPGQTWEEGTPQRSGASTHPTSGACAPGGPGPPSPPPGSPSCSLVSPPALLSDCFTAPPMPLPRLEGGDCFPLWHLGWIIYPWCPPMSRAGACWKRRETHVPAASPLAPLGLGPQPHVYLTGSYRQASHRPPALGSPSVCESEGLLAVAIKGPRRARGQSLPGRPLPVASWVEPQTRFLTHPFKAKLRRGHGFLGGKIRWPGGGGER